jgi:hypothetical protein
VPSDDVVEFGGWPRPPRWVWAAAGVAAVAVLAGMVVARTGPHHAAASSRSRPPTAAASPVPGSRTPAAGSAPAWPSAAGACGSAVDLPQIHLVGQHADVHGNVLVGGAGLRQVTLGGAVSGPLPGLPEHGRLVTNVVAGPGAAYAFDTPCVSSTASVRLYRIAAGAAHRLRTTADALLGGPHLAWAVIYRPRAVLTRALTPLTRGRAVRSATDPVADTAAGLVVVAYQPPPGQRHTVELVDPNTGAVLRRLGEGSPMGAAGHVLLVSLHGCVAPPAHSVCTLESVNLNTGRPMATAELPAGRVPTSGDLASPVFSPDGTLAAFQLARTWPDPRFAAAFPGPPSDVVVLHLRTGRLDMVPGLELPPGTWAGLAFDATGSWLLATVSEGSRGELLAWRPGMTGPALVTSLPGPLEGPPPLLPAPSWWRTGA